jgi:hypothetical protein
MNFFSISNSLNPKVLGHYPQVKEIKQNCNVWNEPKFIEHINFERVSFNPITANAVLYSSSKLTDLISISGMGFTRKLLLSGRLKKILERNSVGGLQFFQSNLIYKNEEINDYWILNSFDINMHFIDIQSSNFVWRKRKEVGGTYLAEVNFNSLDEFIRKIIDDNLEGKLYINKIKIHEGVTEDFFTLLNVEGGVKYIVSEKLKQEIEDAGCTGIEFQPVELSINEWLNGGEREKVYGKS